MDIAITDRSFAALDLSAQTLASLDAMGYKAPTDVQSETIPRAITGKDLVVQSRTGTGKTAAFGIPIVERVDTTRDVVQAVVLAPTRELAIQVAQEVAEIGKGKGVKVLSVYGGDSMERQLEGIRAGAHVIAGTPGRVLDHLRRKTLRFDAVKTFVLDEADRMLDMGFAVEMGEIMEYVPSERQTLLFSATIPLGIRGLIYHYLSDPEWVLLSEDQIYVKEVAAPLLPDSEAPQGSDPLQAPRVREPGFLDDLLQHQGGDAPRAHLPPGQGAPRGHALLGPAAAKREKVMAQLPGRRDPPPRHHRRGLAGDRHRGPLARLHLLDSRFAGAVHPPGGTHGAGGEERAGDQPDLGHRPHELQPAGEALPRRRAGAGRCRPTRRCRRAKVERIVTRLAAEGQTLPLDDFAEFGPIARRVGDHEHRDRILALLLRKYFQAPPPEKEDEEVEGAPPPPRRDEGGAFRRRRRGRR